MVRKKGVEPLRPFGHKILSLARLPVPPLPLEGEYNIVMRLASRVGRVSRGGN
jgi:hypothetical protein